MKKVLFICKHNSARSQIAEALLKQMCPEIFEVYSAGLRPGPLNPLAVEVMAEIGIDISRNTSKSVFPFIREHPPFNYVISVCDLAAQEHCPSYPAGVRQLQWSFPDPSEFTGSHEEKLARARQVRDAISARLKAWCAEMCVMEPA